MPLRALPDTLEDWHGKRVLVRVDWNIPLQGQVDAESGLKIERSVPLIRRLQEAGAKVLLVTHVGRPTEAREPSLSTKRLLPRLQAYRLAAEWLDGDYAQADGRAEIAERVVRAKPGSVFLLENVRYAAGEEKNAAAFAKALASLADVFVNEAFAACHRAHASVVGVAKLLPSFAGPALEAEVAHLAALRSPKGPYVAFLGGKKISTKLPVIDALAKVAQTVFLGGAMAVTLEAARGKKIGASFVEPGQKAAATRLLKRKNVVLPDDYIVATSLAATADTRISDLSDLRADEYVVDIGPRTLVRWADTLRTAKTALWNGPMGITEIAPFAAGSRGLARFLGFLPHGARTVVGGGDTIPVLGAAGVMDRISYVSTGGGAMLEYLVDGDALPGLVAVSSAKER